MEKRILGKTNEKLSVIGFGGIVVMNETAKDAARFVSKAIDRGINYFDVAPQYGNAQEMLGPALKPYRSSVFLSCKTLERTKEGARRELEDSLKKLKTDHFDLYQFHSVITLDEVKKIMGPGGAFECFLEARDKGLARFLGFTAHSEEAAIAMMDLHDFTSVLFPFNWALWFKDSYGPAVLGKASSKGMGILALKALARGAWGASEKRIWNKCWYAPVDTFEEASAGLRFTLSLPVTAAVSPGHAELLWLACDIADNFTPISTEELEALKAKSGNIETLAEGLKVN
ncbi:MAG: aldo/keto reductase [Actinobacteria bacterium]|nr:aldo/keto reductase [Actinomycetota bacterium]